MGTQTYKLVCVFCLAAVWGLALLSGCSGPKTMPKDWPIPELTLPERSKLVQVFKRPNPPGALVAATSWTVIFKSSMNRAQVIADVESKLKPLRYMRAASRLEPSKDSRIYLALDKRTQVLLDTKPPPPNSGKCVLTIVVNSQVTDMSRDATPI
jgi:hypothetical protein